MKKAALIFSAFLTLTSLFACSTTHEKAGKTSPNPQQKVSKRVNLETVYGFEVRPNELLFLLKTTGCSDAEHFDMKIDKTKMDTPEQKSAIYSVRLKRIKPDRCKAMPRLQYVTLPWRESPFKESQPRDIRVQLINPFAPVGKLKRPEPK